MSGGFYLQGLIYEVYVNTDDYHITSMSKGGSKRLQENSIMSCGFIKDGAFLEYYITKGKNVKILITDMYKLSRSNDEKLQRVYRNVLHRLRNEKLKELLG